ncbi:hypothetical protein [Okeania sp.]|uniref:hypothetical protein n=1 Tax=Okeania sp. TaxID=3100323 RepID=UPI002B4B4858|nr:hypothetical protein [Okeania sp.]MEB3340651.1 hypothetical protein [Okeania sp.]
MSTTVNASNDTVNSSDTASETALSLGMKIISVMGLTLFTGSYVTSWQRSLAEYAKEQQGETIVATSDVSSPTATKTPEVGTTGEVDTTGEVALVVAEETIVVPETPVIPKITDSDILNKLKTSLYNKIDTNWKQYPTFSENLVYQVTTNAAGDIAKYQHINEAASKYISETPLPQLTGFSTTDVEENAREPIAEFLVVLTPNGVIQVNQWVTVEEVEE